MLTSVSAEEGIKETANKYFLTEFVVCVSKIHKHPCHLIKVGLLRPYTFNFKIAQIP